MYDAKQFDAVAVEARARALRAAYMREMMRGLFARLRRSPRRAAHA